LREGDGEYDIQSYSPMSKTKVAITIDENLV